MQFLRGEQRKTLTQVITALRTKDAQRARTRAVAFLRSLFQDAVQYVKVLFHLSFFVFYGTKVVQTY